MKAIRVKRENVRSIIWEQITGAHDTLRFHSWLVNGGMYLAEETVYFVTPFVFFEGELECSGSWGIVRESQLRKYCEPFELPEDASQWFEVARKPSSEIARK